MRITPECLGSAEFRQDYGLRLPYVAGAMVKGIASTAMVVRLARAGCLAVFGAGGVALPEVEAAVGEIQAALTNGESFGVNLLAHPGQSAKEMAAVEMLLRCGVRTVEASAYMEVTDALARFRLAGVRQDHSGRLVVPNRVMAKVSRPEVAEQFLSPAPRAMVERLLAAGHLTQDEAALAGRLPIASDVTVEADSGGHTDMGVTAVLLPAIIRLRDAVQEHRQYQDPVRVGSGGGIGSPEAAAGAFVLGADYVVTGSINQCTVEAGTSDAVKDMLQRIGVQDTAYAPAGDMFEMGSRIQVMKKGLFFPARANKLHDLWRTLPGLDALDAATRREIQDKYFQRSFDDVYAETRAFYMREAPEEITRADSNPKVKMALVFRWYFVHSMRLALAGGSEQRVNWQIHTGPAMGAFNQWLAGSSLEDWRSRNVDTIAEHLMQGCADYVSRRFSSLDRASRA